jgi:ATP-binding cassette subfamily B (MDR/TAP) protein 1
MGDKKNKKRVESSIFRLTKYSKRESPFFILGCLAAIANGTTFPIFGLLLSNLIKT